MAAGTNLVAEVTEIFNTYNLEVKRATEAAARESAELTAQMLKATSPKRARGKGRGKYARGWRVTKKRYGTLTSYIVHNGSCPGLTQLLEYGHVSRNQYGSYGRVRAIKHIGNAADAGIQRFELAIRARLRG